MGIFDKLFGGKKEKEKKEEKVEPKKDWSFYANRAETYLMEGKFTEAIVDYTKAIELPKQESLKQKLKFLTTTLQRLRFSRGVSYYKRGLSTHSKDDFKHAIEDLELSKTERGGPWYEPQRWAMGTLICGDAYFAIGDYAKAANCYTELSQRWIGIAQFLPITESDIKRKRDIALSIPNIGKLKGRRDVEGLIKALGHKVERVRAHAAEALGEIKDKRAVEPLIEALKDEGVRNSATTALGRIEDKRALEPLIKVLREDPNKFVRGSAAYALGRIKDKKAVEPLMEALLDKDSYVRKGAAVALGNIGDKKSVEPLIRTLEDEDPYVRSSAALALGKIGDERVVELLKKILEDKYENVRVRKAAKEALKKLSRLDRG